MIKEPLAIANSFNQFFSSIGSDIQSSVESQGIPIDNFLVNKTDAIFEFEKFSESSILYFGEKLKSSSSPGPDGLPQKVLKLILPALARPLAFLLNLSIASGYIPLEFKTALVTPVFKQGEPSILSNYRPISNLNVLGKLFELAIKKQLVSHLEENNLLHPFQFGFRAKRNTEQALPKVQEFIFQNFNQHSLAIFLDVKKAFDKVVVFSGLFILS